jgi:hypothetical protein
MPKLTKRGSEKNYCCFCNKEIPRGNICKSCKIIMGIEKRLKAIGKSLKGTKVGYDL